MRVELPSGSDRLQFKIEVNSFYLIFRSFPQTHLISSEIVVVRSEFEYQTTHTPKMRNEDVGKTRHESGSRTQKMRSSSWSLQPIELDQQPRFNYE